MMRRMRRSTPWHSAGAAIAAQCEVELATIVQRLEEPAAAARQRPARRRARRREV